MGYGREWTMLWSGHWPWGGVDSGYGVRWAVVMSWGGHCHGVEWTVVMWEKVKW